MDMFSLLKSSIIAEYQQVMIDMLAKIYHLLTRDSYLSDRQIYELKDKEFRQTLEAEKSDISFVVNFLIMVKLFTLPGKRIG